MTAEGFWTADRFQAWRAWSHLSSPGVTASAPIPCKAFLSSSCCSIESLLLGLNRCDPNVQMRVEFTPSPQLYPFESRWLEVDGIRVHYVDEGSGTPILM